MAEMIYAPEDISQAKSATVFMAGSIDMGKAVDWQQQMFKKTKGLNITYLNPRRVDLLASSFTRQVARIERGLQKELTHGNLESVRTILDMRDAMSAYWLSIKYCRPGEAYNIGGNKILKVGEYLECLKGLSEVPIPSRFDPALLRPADVTLQVPCVDKFIEATNWQPQYKFEESVVHLLEYWREKADLEARNRSLIK